MIGYGHGVTLGPLEREDLSLIRSWRNNPDIYKWCRQFEPISHYSHLEWFDSQAKDPAIRMYSVVDSGEIVGVCGLTDIDPVNRRAEFSLYIGPEHWGRALGTKALSTLIEHGFRALGLNCIWGETFQGNPAAKMFTALGFKKEGTRRGFYFREGKWIDADLYSILASEYFGRVSLGRIDSNEDGGTTITAPLGSDVPKNLLGVEE